MPPSPSTAKDLHASGYNANLVAIGEWGCKPEQSIWFHVGYAHLLQDVKAAAQLKGKANQYLRAPEVRQL